MKRILTAALALCLLWQGIPTAFAAEEKVKSSGVEVAAKSVILVERETGTVLYQQAEHEKLEPASVTKVMTMLLVAEAIDAGQISLDDPVTCSAYAASMGGSQVYLEKGNRCRFTTCSRRWQWPRGTTRRWRWRSTWPAASPPLWRR